MPSLWHKLEFSAAKATRIRVPRSAMQKYLRFSRGEATEVVMSSFVGQDARFLPHVATVCRALETLRIESGWPNESLIKAVSITHSLKSLILSHDCRTTLDCVSQIFGGCSSLVRAEFHYVKVPDRSRRPSWPATVSRLRTLILNLKEVEAYTMPLIVGVPIYQASIPVKSLLGSPSRTGDRYS